MPEHTQDFYRGVLLPDDRFSMDNYDATESSVTQKGPGVDAYTAAATAEGYMDLHASGTSQAAAGQIVQTNYPGLPQGENHGGRFTWKNNEDPDSSYRGWHPYSRITGCEFFKWMNIYGNGNRYSWHPSAVTTADHYVHVAFVEYDGTSPTTHGLKVKTLDPTTETWGAEVNVAVSAGLTPSVYSQAPTIAELPNGRLLICCGPGKATFYSDDRGASWSLGSHRLESEGEVPSDMPLAWQGKSMQRRSMVYHNGYITLLQYRISLEPSPPGTPGPCTELDHYVSDDFGNSWTLVERFQAGAWGISLPTGAGTLESAVTDAELVVLDGGQVCMVYRDSADDPAFTPPEGVPTCGLRMAKKSAPFSKFSDHPSFNAILKTPPGYPKIGSTTSGAVGPFVLTKDPEGFITVVARGSQFASVAGGSVDRLATGQLFVARYRQSDIARAVNGDVVPTATDSRHHYAGPFTMSDMVLTPTPADQWPLLRVDGETVPSHGTTRRNTSCMTPYKGSMLLVTGFENTENRTNPAGGTQYGDVSGSLLLVKLGGYDNYDRANGTGWGILGGAITPSSFSYLPIELPVALDAGVGDFSLFVASTCDREIVEDGLFVDAAAGARYRMTYTNTSAIHARVRVNGAAGGGSDVTTNYIRISVGGVELRLGDTEAQVWDMTDIASGVSNSLCSKITFPSAAFRDWYVTYYTNSSGDLKAWVMYKDPTSSVWTRVDTLGPGTTLNATPGTSASAANESWSAGTLVGSANSSHWKLINFHDGGAAWWSNADYHPAEMQGRCFSTKPLYITDGWKMASRGSAAFMGDQWSSVTRYEHPVSAIDPAVAPSPRVQWRSLDTSTEQTVVWDFAGSVSTRPLSTAWGIHLSGINFKTAHFEGWNGAAWVGIATLDAEADFTNLEQTRAGNVLRPSPSGSYTANRYIQLDELAGSYAVFPGTPDEVRTIAANSEGGWTRSGGVMPPKTAELRVKGSLGSLPASGTFHIREDSVTAIVYDQTTAYEKYRLRIPANQVTAQGDYRIGACVIGEILFFGQDYSWGRVQALEPNQEILTARSGDRLVEKLGPPRRRVELSWVEGWDSSETSGYNPTGFTHLTADSLLPVGVRQDPTVIAGMLRRVDGAKNPLVYLPRIVPGKAATPGIVRNILGKSRHMYGRLVGGVTTNSIIGDEDSNEVTAINAIVIEEEI